MSGDKVERRSVGIVERLRNTHARDPGVPLRVHMLEAADEIERWNESYARWCVAMVRAGVPAFGTLDEAIEKLAAKVNDSDRKAVIEECAKVCDQIEATRWDQYRRGEGEARANPHTQGESDGAAQCAIRIRALTGGGT